MKKIYLLSIALICYAFTYAVVVTPEAAKAIGANYLSQHGVAATTSALELTYTSEKDGLKYFYAFSTAHSFVIVSADDAVKPVLGYSREGAFNVNMPAHILSWLGGYTKQIDYAVKNNVAATPEIAGQWSDLRSNRRHATARTTSVSPLLSTTWDQSPYYNDDCPYDAGAAANCVTGCVATATAQVMKFWSWPAHGTGTYSYTSSSYGTLSADFGATTYNWSSMPNSVTGPNAAVARLMSDVGISVNMNYSPTESSSYVISSASPITNCAEYALKTYFNYVPSLHGEQRSSYVDATWISMLETNLNAGEPVIYTGAGTAGGHCFVFDGYDGSNNMHVNWGWGNVDDGYFAIDALNPAILGTGGGAGGFNSDQTAIFGIKPPDTTTTPTTTMALYDYVNLSAASIGYGAAFTVSTNAANYGTTTFSGDFCTAAFNASGTFVTYIDSVLGTTLPAGGAFASDFSLPTTGLFSMLPGTYTIGVFYRVTGGGWVALANNGPYTNFPTLTVVNHAPIELYSAMSPSPTPLVQGSAASVNLNIYNSGATDFTGSYDVSLYHLDGTFACEIQNMAGMSLPAGSVYTSPFLTFSTSSVTAAPGTYLMALTYNAGSSYLAGSDYFQNPVYITVVAPALLPDMYEVNNTAATAYTLPLTFISNVAATSTPGSNLHIVTDQDYYKIALAPGYTYTITARVNDDVSADDGLAYTADAIWSYSTDGGATWSSTYDDVMPGTIIITSGIASSVIFHCAPHYAGQTGTYQLKLSNVTRLHTEDVAQVNLDAVKIFPVPASELVTVDISGTNAHAATAVITDMTGRKLYETNVTGQNIIQLPVSPLAAGMYFAEITTDEGVIKRKITVTK